MVEVRWAIRAMLAGMVILNGCGGGGGGGSSSAPAPAVQAEAPVAPEGSSSAGYVLSDAEFANPERGFHDWIDLMNGSSFSFVSAGGLSLAYAGVNLSAYRSTTLPSSFLTQLAAGFTKVRQAGIKVILRFFYASFIGDADASKSRILGHISQLAPTLQANSDAIAFVQGGFIGAWGEWHASTNGLDNDTDRHDILYALLDAVPTSRFVQIRTPHFKSGVFGSSSPVTLAQAFDGSHKSRTGHHNDGFLNGASNDGTYINPIDTWKSYVAQDSLFVPIGGETNDVNLPYTTGVVGIEEMEDLHFSFLNRLYHPDVIAGWIADGTMSEIQRRLGYRISLLDAIWTSAVAPGGEIELTIHLKNTGFASMYNERPLYVVLDNGATRLAAQVASVDPRLWMGGSEATFVVKLRVPATAVTGTYALALWLPDAAASLQNDARYAVRFGNDGVWDSGEGYNVLTTGFSISATASGPVDPSATQFVEIP